jgi:uncharacterized protein
MDRSEVSRLTEEYGGEWGINHTRRLLHLISAIAEGQGYDAEAVWFAAHLHDWGGYKPWAKNGVDHAIRSLEVADAFLSERACPEPLKSLVLECIELHHAAGTSPSRSLESVLLRDADVLDFLGPVGVLRDFSKNTREMRRAYEIAKRRREKLPALLALEKSREIAVRRVQQMDELLARFAEDSFGCF